MQAPPPEPGERPRRRLPNTGAFVPGVIIVERYRMIARVGRGGMGEVYRADDLRLGQSVALKFLPPELERADDARERLLAVVRLARTIAHPNVCRVCDIGNLPGEHGAPSRTFLCMEYIDGEDLGSLLRRIGRLPPAKALDIARQLCAGLSAAHEKDVLHLDLKPANVMIDGRGQARIADFGIAVAPTNVHRVLRGTSERTSTRSLALTVTTTKPAASVDGPRDPTMRRSDGRLRAECRAKRWCRRRCLRTSRIESSGLPLLRSTV